MILFQPLILLICSPFREDFTRPNTKRFIENLLFDCSCNQQRIRHQRERVMDWLRFSSLYTFFSVHSPKVSCSGLHQKSAFTGIVWQPVRLAALCSGFIPFLAVFSERQGEAPGPVCSSGEETHSISLWPRPVTWPRRLKDPHSSATWLHMCEFISRRQDGCCPAVADITTFALKGSLCIKHLLLKQTHSFIRKPKCCAALIHCIVTCSLCWSGEEIPAERVDTQVFFTFI